MERASDLLHGQWHLDANGSEAAFAFGHGLGFTSFELGPASVAGDTARVSVSLRVRRGG